jgi:hypothetical protein
MPREPKPLVGEKAWPGTSSTRCSTACVVIRSNESVTPSSFSQTNMPARGVFQVASPEREGERRERGRGRGEGGKEGGGEEGEEKEKEREAEA